MRKAFLITATSLAVLLAAGSLSAHHSWLLDRSKLIALTGTATRLEFANPHVQVYFQVKDENGATDTWQAGGPSPNQLARGGWTRDTIKPGDEIIVAGYRNRDGAKVVRFDSVTLPNGQVFSGYRGR